MIIKLDLVESLNPNYRLTIIDCDLIFILSLKYLIFVFILFLNAVEHCLDPSNLISLCFLGTHLKSQTWIVCKAVNTNQRLDSHKFTIIGRREGALQGKINS